MLSGKDGKGGKSGLGRKCGKSGIGGISDGLVSRGSDRLGKSLLTGEWVVSMGNVVVTRWGVGWWSRWGVG